MIFSIIFLTLILIIILLTKTHINNTNAFKPIYSKEKNYIKLENNTNFNITKSLSSDQLSTNRPTINRPTTNRSVTNRPTTNRPTTNRPTTNRPTTNRPTTNKPTTNKPTTNKPTTNRLTTNRSLTNKSTTNIKSSSSSTINKPLTYSTGNYFNKIFSKSLRNPFKRYNPIRNLFKQHKENIINIYTSNIDQINNKEAYFGDKKVNLTILELTQLITNDKVSSAFKLTLNKEPIMDNIDIKYIINNLNTNIDAIKRQWNKDKSRDFKDDFYKEINALNNTEREKIIKYLNQEIPGLMTEFWINKLYSENFYNLFLNFNITDSDFINYFDKVQFYKEGVNSNSQKNKLNQYSITNRNFLKVIEEKNLYHFMIRVVLTFSSPNLPEMGGCFIIINNKFLIAEINLEISSKTNNLEKAYINFYLSEESLNDIKFI